MLSRITIAAGGILFGIMLSAGRLSAEVRAGKGCQQTLSHDEYRAAGLHLSQLAAGIDRDYEYQLAAAFRARVLPNPGLSAEKTYTGMELAGANYSQTEVTLSQPFRLSHFGSRASLAQVIKDAGSVSRQRDLLQLSLSYSYQYYQLLALQKIESVLSDVESRTSERVSQVKEGVAKGLFSLGDEKLFEGEKYRLRAQREGVKAERARLQQQIQSDTGMECVVVSTGVPVLISLPEESEVISRAGKSPMSELSRLHLMVEVAKKRADVAELDVVPEIVPRAIYQRTNDGGDFFGAGISIDLPIWNRNNADRIEADADKRKALRQKQILDNGGFSKQVRSLYAAAKSAGIKAELYEKNVVPSFEQALNSEEKKYEKGGGSVLQVWQMLRTYSDARIQSQRFLLEALALRIELSLLVGEEI